MNKLTSFECIKQGISDFILEEQLAAEEAKRNQFKYTEEGFELLMAEKQALAGVDETKRAQFVTSQRLDEIKDKKRQIERVYKEFKVFFEAGESDYELEEAQPEV